MKAGNAKQAWLVTLLCAATLGACGKSTDNEIRLAGWVSSPFESDAMHSVVDQYNANNDGVPIAYQPIQANYIEKIQLMLGTGTAPDVFMLESFWAPTLINYDTLMPLDDLIAADPEFDLADFEPTLLDAFRHDGKLYGLPKDYSTIALFYNPEFLAEAGIDRPPTNWRQLADYAAELSQDMDGDGNTDIFGFGTVDSVEYVLPFIWQNGGELITGDGGIDIDNAAAIEAIEYLKKLRDDGVAAVPTDVGASWNMEAFGRKRLAMTISGLWAVNFLETTFPDTPYRVVPVPMGQRREAIAYVVGYVIPRAANDKEQAWQLLRHLTSKPGQNEWAKLGLGLPPRRSVVDNFGLHDDPIRSVFIDTAAYSRTWQLGPNQRVMDELQTAMQAIFLVDSPIDEALRRANDRL